MSKDCGYWFIIKTMKFSGDHVASQTVALSIWDMKQIQRSVPNSAPKVTPARSSLHVLITSGTMWGDSNKTRKMSLWIICLSCLRLLDCIFLSKGWDLHAGKTVFYRMPRLGASLRSASSLIPHHLSTTILFLIMMPLTRFKQVETGAKWRCGIIKRHLLEMKIAQKAFTSTLWTIWLYKGCYDMRLGTELVCNWLYSAFIHVLHSVPSFVESML